MLFQITDLWQLLGWLLVFVGLIIMNEIGRRSKLGGILDSRKRDEDTTSRIAANP